jgi:hypothetical protein
MKSVWASQRPDDQVLDMPEDALEDVKTYVRWAYAGVVQIPLYHHSPKLAIKEHAEEAERVYVALANAFVFGERVVDTSYTNAIILHIMAAWKVSEWSPGPKFATVLYGGTLPGNPARRLLIDMVFNVAHDDSSQPIGWMTTILQGYPQEALVDIVKAMIQSRKTGFGGTRPWITNPSGYLVKEETRIKNQPDKCG